MSPSARGATTDGLTTPGWLPAARVVCVLLVLVNLVWFLGSLPAHYRELLVPCEGARCYFAYLNQQEVTLLNELGMSIEFYAAYQLLPTVTVAAAMLGLGILIFVRRSKDAIGLLAAFALASFGLSGDWDWPLTQRLPALAALGWTLDSLTLTAVVLLFFVFPDGRAVPRWTRYPAALIVAVEFCAMLPIALIPEARRALDSGLGDLVIVGFLVAGVVAQVQRYRFHSTAVERQQTKWVLFGLTATVLAYLLWVLTFLIFPLAPGAPRLYWNLFGLTGLALLITALPISLAVSILRYRLFDIDVLINRTLIYGSLSGALALVYFVSVILLQQIFPAESQAAIVLSTLAIAALFNPLRRRIQVGIDKRFYRSKYDAERTLAAFGRALRQEIDFDALCNRLVSTAGDSVQPKTISLWVRPPRTRAGQTERRDKGA